MSGIFDIQDSQVCGAPIQPTEMEVQKDTAGLVIPEIPQGTSPPLLPGKKSGSGGTAMNNRLFIEGVLWRLRNDARWRDIPERFGKWDLVTGVSADGLSVGFFIVLTKSYAGRSTSNA